MKLFNDNSIGFNNNHDGIHRPRAVNQPQRTSTELNSFRRIKYNFWIASLVQDAHHQQQTMN